MKTTLEMDVIDLDCIVRWHDSWWDAAKLSRFCHDSYFSKKKTFITSWLIISVTHLLTFNRQYNSSLPSIVSSYWILWWRLRWLYRFSMLLCDPAAMLKLCSHRRTPRWWSFGLNPGMFHTLECVYFSVRAHITCALTVGKFFVLWLRTLCSALLWEVGRLIWVCLLCACSTRGENMPCEFTVVPWTELNQRLDVS